MTASARHLAIREATTADLPFLRSLAAAAFDREPAGGGDLVDLLYHRPGQPAPRLVATVDGVPVAFAFGSVREGAGYLDAIAVDETVRLRGVGTALLADLETRLTEAGALHLAIGGNTWFYAWPGIDLGYTAALCFAERHGYLRERLVQNMDVSLAAWAPGRAADVLARHASKATVQRATPADWPELETFVRDRFTEVWRNEAELSLHREQPTTFVARSNNRITGFACHGVYRPDWFGPLGVDQSCRGEGLGEALVLQCLDDLAAAGVDVAQIAWIGPMHFYARTVAARCGRVFAVLEKDPTHALRAT